MQDDIIRDLKSQFGFRKDTGEWLREGKCPKCGKHEAFCAAVEPKIVRCGRQGNCRWEDSVRNLLPELFEEWSTRHPVTHDDPTAAADAYLRDGRGLDLQHLRGSYTQETYRDAKTGNTSATVRFKVGDTYWERIIDKPGRFSGKAHFAYGGKPGGHCWIPPKITLEQLALAEDIWITEGIFNAAALYQGADILAVSGMSCMFWPEHFLSQLRGELQRLKRATRPRLVFAYDPGAAGVVWSRRFVKRAKKEGWTATAAQVRPDGEGTTKDWNDLLLEHLDWRGDKDRAPLGPETIQRYLWNGAVTVADSARAKAKMLHEGLKFSSFDFRFDDRLWWCKVNYEGDDGDQKRNLQLEEICNCAFRLLYRERDEIADDTNYFLQIDFPDDDTPVKARFSSSACANSGEFKKRLMAFAGTWMGSGEQLDRIIRNQTRALKVVEPIPFTGYSATHSAWLLGDMAVRKGRVVKLNSENYFDFGKQAVKLRSAERILDIEYDADKITYDWVEVLWTAFGPKGLIALAFFTMSFFAVQIREKQKSLGFLEITGLPGSGKSTLVEFLWKLAGRAGYEGFDPNKGTTAFLARSLMKVANLPVGLIEGGRDDDKAKGYKQFDYNELLVLYNGRSPRGTGQKSGGFETSEPPFLGSIYLMQNERIDAIPAVLERLMSMDIDKSRWSPATKTAAVQLENWPIESVSGTIVHVICNEAKYLKFYFDRFAHHDAEMGKRVEGLSNTRPIKCHSQLAAGVEALVHLFPTVRADWIAETLQLVDAMALDRQNSCGGDHPTVSDFWDKVQYLLEREKPEDHGEGKSVNQHRERDSYIAVNLVDFEARCRNAGIAPPNMDQLKKLLRNSKSRKWIATKNVNNPAGRVMSCWMFEQPKKAERII
ncbi:hypothetical protein A8V01_02610 [Novosphingobium guangzhouense]|uniref:Bifunctional DNA primase/helicase n=1 Tax=Novosphingobium guangzhouense TaxID=1850347 RepID=A0A2K2G6D9_9SPHN|nr:hypothetical protein A8V01_02610 [Novosphingobium guangzhouense]